MQRRSHVFLVTSILVVIISRFQPHRGIDHSALCCNYTVKKFAAWIKLKFSCNTADIMLIDARRISTIQRISTIHKILNAKTKKYLIEKLLNRTFTLLCLYVKNFHCEKISIRRFFKLIFLSN